MQLSQISASGSRISHRNHCAFSLAGSFGGDRYGKRRENDPFLPIYERTKTPIRPCDNKPAEPVKCEPKTNYRVASKKTAERRNRRDTPSPRSAIALEDYLTLKRTSSACYLLRDRKATFPTTFANFYGKVYMIETIGNLSFSLSLSLAVNRETHVTLITRNLSLRFSGL